MLCRVARTPGVRALCAPLRVSPSLAPRVLSRPRGFCRPAGGPDEQGAPLAFVWNAPNVLTACAFARARAVRGAFTPLHELKRLEKPTTVRRIALRKRPKAPSTSGGHRPARSCSQQNQESHG